MSIYELLSVKQDPRKGGNDCLFNGYLEDYLETLEDSNAEVETLKALLNEDESARVIVGLHFGVSKESISNAIIRYKDIFKLNDNALTIPYIVYGKKDDNAKALILVEKEYVYAKGLYYALTEPSSPFQEVKNDIVAMEMVDTPEVVNTYGKLYTKFAGQIQRELDRKHFKTYDEAYDYSLKLATDIKDNVFENAANAEDKDSFIKSCVASWYLIKKYVYVQYMVDKNILNTVHEGNVKQQRNKAKENADSIRFVSVAEMWRGKPQEEKANEE